MMLLQPTTKMCQRTDAFRIVDKGKIKTNVVRMEKEWSSVLKK